MLHLWIKFGCNWISTFQSKQFFHFLPNMTSNNLWPWYVNEYIAGTNYLLLTDMTLSEYRPSFRYTYKYVSVIGNSFLSLSSWKRVSSLAFFTGGFSIPETIFQSQYDAGWGQWCGQYQQVQDQDQLVWDHDPDKAKTSWSETKTETNILQSEIKIEAKTS